MNSRVKDRKGERFGKLVVLEFSHIHNGHAQWKCKCDCGNEKVASSSHLMQGNTKSCGCIAPAYSETERFWKLTYRSYLNNSSRRGYGFELTPEEVIEICKGDCWYCGAKPKLSIYAKSTSMSETRGYRNGIDRVDNEFGYSMDNCVSCCENCNMMKRGMSAPDFIDVCVRVAERHV